MNPQEPFSPQGTPTPPTPPATAPISSPQAPSPAATTPVVSQPKKRRIAWVVILVAVILVLVASVIIYLQTSKTSPSNATSQETTTNATTGTTTDSSTDPFKNMDQVSNGTTTATTDCYSLTIPDGYTAGSPDNATCSIVLTESAQSATTIKISAFSSAYCDQMYDVIECINARFEEVAKNANRTFYGASKVSINAYRTGLTYIADTNGVKHAYYNIEDAADISHATEMSSITTFLINGLADTDDHDADTRLIAKSFVIK